MRSLRGFVPPFPLVPAVLSAFAVLTVTVRSSAEPAQMTLPEALKLAESAAPSLQISKLRAERALAEEAVAKLPRYPRVFGSLAGSALALRDTLPPLRSVPFVFYSQSAEARANLRWTLLDFGRTSSSVEAAEERSEEARQAVETERASTTEMAASLFLQIVHDDRLVEARKISLKNRQRYAIFAKALVERGIKSGIDDLRARVAVESAKTELLRAESKAQEDRVRLGALLGVPTARLQNLAKIAIPSPTDLEAPEKAAAVALSTRSEIKGAEADVRARDALVGAARAAYLPTVSLSLDGAYRQSNFDVIDGLIPRAEASGGVVVSFPIVDPHVWTNVRVAEVDAALSRGQLTRVKQSVGVEAQYAAIELQSARAILSRAKEQASAAEGALLVIEARYQSGVSNPLELVDAETNDTDAREGVASAQLKVDLAALSLLMATSRDAALRK